MWREGQGPFNSRMLPDWLWLKNGWPSEHAHVSKSYRRKDLLKCRQQQAAVFGDPCVAGCKVCTSPRCKFIRKVLFEGPKPVPACEVERQVTRLVVLDNQSQVRVTRFPQEVASVELRSTCGKSAEPVSTEDIRSYGHTVHFFRA